MLQKSVLFDCINNSFDKIYVITLKRSRDRHTIIEKLLQGLDYEIFWGVDGSNLDYKELLKKNLYCPEITRRLNITGKELTPGEIGYSLSHIGIYKKILIKSSGRF